ncbi:MAG: hypothetical protein EZS28_044893, partial [Streblomastix strix]
MEQFVATVYKARQGFGRERTVEQTEENGQLSELHYNNVIQSLMDIEEFVDKVYEEQHHQAFKIQFNFGVIYEEYRYDQNDQVYFQAILKLQLMILFDQMQSYVFQ